MFYYSIPDMIEAWLADAKVDVLLPCALCVADVRLTEDGASKRMVNPLSRTAHEALSSVHSFTWESVEEAFQAHKPSMQCKANRQVPLERLAPDITLSGIMSFEYAVSVCPL